MSFSTIRKKTLKPVASGARCGEGKIFKSLEEKKTFILTHKQNQTRQLIERQQKSLLCAIRNEKQIKNTLQFKENRGKREE